MIRAPEFLMYASDHPHHHGPGADLLLDVLDDSDREAVLEGNASELYSL
jgi:predicted TIM-barrel fold metal-dependent hydrolase